METKLSPEQSEAVFFPSSSPSSENPKQVARNLVIEAGAGAGKTTLLTERVHWLLNAAPRAYRLEPQELILVTFSRAADEELRRRVEKRFKSANLSDENLEKVLGRLHISTIDSLFMQLSNNLFPLWWEEKRSQLSEAVLAEWGLTSQRFPPTLTLVSEEELRPELSELVLNFIEKNASNPSEEVSLLDFILAGAFESKSFHTGGTTSERYRGLERITAAMLHENLLRDDAPPLHFALEKIHPASLSVLNGLQNLARTQFHKRLMHGRVTHSDRMLFLYHLLVAREHLHEGSFFHEKNEPHLPVQCKELIVDEYQDTNQLQHEILTALLSPRSGRMVVVGDPKQSIYGFRSAHVGVFQRLKNNPTWKLLELTRNFRSHPDLLPWINYLSDMSFAYKNNKIPEQFLGTTFSLTAQQTFVASKALDAGRASELSKSDEEQPRVLLLGASLSKERCELPLPENSPNQHAFTTWAIAKELQLIKDKSSLRWKDMVILCETNEWAVKTHLQLQSYGLPSVAKTSRPADHDSEYRLRCEEIGLLLGKWLCGPLNAKEFAQLIWSGWFEFSHVAASELIAAASHGRLGGNFVTNNEARQNLEGKIAASTPETWQPIRDHLVRCRALATQHFFSAWQVFRWGFQNPAAAQQKSMNIEMENVALALHQVLEVWSTRRSLESSQGVWPDELLQNKLKQLRLNEAESDPSEDAITVCTIHGAKGLEWPIVVFWPSSKRDRSPENFVMKSGENATQIKWLAEDTESASLLPWILNPNPPEDIVSIEIENNSGEQIVRWSADLQDRLEQDYERQRVFYTAYTRAREMLVLVSPAVTGRVQKNLRDKLAALKEGDEFDPVQLKLNGLESTVFGCFADTFFDLRKANKRGSKPKTPWLGHTVDAALRNQDWKGILAARDYGPDWLHEMSQSLPVKPISENNQKPPELENNWQDIWAEARHQKALLSPWQKPAIPEITPLVHGVEKSISSVQTKESVPEAGPSELQEKLSASEQGLRFHALMEHGGASLPTEKNFLSKLLSSALVREHELEMWGAFDVTPSLADIASGLQRSQRRILDLYCVVPASKWPKKLWDAYCVGENQTAQFTLEKTLQTKIANEPNLHLVIDFKTGQPDPKHLEQMRQYLRWVKHILASQPQLLVGALTDGTLFAGSDKPLLGILYYTSANLADLDPLFAGCLVVVDKNTSLLFVSAE